MCLQAIDIEFSYGKALLVTQTAYLSPARIVWIQKKWLYNLAIPENLMIDVDSDHSAAFRHIRREMSNYKKSGRYPFIKNLTFIIYL